METPTIPTPTESPPPAETSLANRLTNVYAAPGEVFDEVKASPVKTGNWLVPILISCVAVIAYIAVVFSQEAIIRGMRETQEKAIQKQVDAGKIPQAQADTIIQGMEKFMTPTLMALFGGFGGVMTIFTMTFAVACVLWLASTFIFKTPVPYLKMVEFTGLTMMVDALEKIVRALLAIWKGSMLATLGPILLVENPSMSNKTHLYLSMLDVIDVWWLSLLALALSKAAGVSFWKTAPLIFVVWFGCRALLIFFTPG